MKHRIDAPQASISLVLQRLAEACCVGGGGDVMAAVGLLRPFGSSLCASVSSADDTLVAAVTRRSPALFSSTSQSCQCRQISKNPRCWMFITRWFKTLVQKRLLGLSQLVSDPVGAADGREAEGSSCLRPCFCGKVVERL